MNQTLYQVGSLLLFQLKTLVVSTSLSCELGFRLACIWIGERCASLRPSLALGFRDKRVDDPHGVEGQEWVVVDNAENDEGQAKVSRRRKKPTAQPAPNIASKDTPLASDSSAASKSFCLYEGLVRHHRVHPISHFFQYKVRYALVNLDSCPDWFRTTSAAFHMTADEARAYVGSHGAVWLLTNPVSVGYEQNPISVYYCYTGRKASTDSLAICIAEVTNTPWGERVLFTFDPTDDIVPKPLHVSPFMDMSSSWAIKASPPDAQLDITFIARHPDQGPYFTATLRATEVVGDRHPEAFFWLTPHKVAIWIYWQAFWLWWKGVSPFSHPTYTDGPRYRERVLERAKAKEGVDAGVDIRKRGKRSSGLSCPVFEWRDAKDPPWK